MSQKDFRLSGSALALRHFAAEDLAIAAECKLATARSWIQRNRMFLEEGAQRQAAGRGRPSTIWRLREGAAGDLRRRLDRFDLGVVVRQLTDAQPSALLDIEEQLDVWKLALRLELPSAGGEHTSLRQLIRVAWEDYAALFENAGELPKAHLATIAAFEKEAGAGAPPDSENLRDIARWIGWSLDQMAGREVKDEFAALVLRLRADARTEAHGIKVTAAALAAPVWADEVFADAPISSAAFARGVRIADLAEVDQVISQIRSAIGGVQSYCIETGDAQAVLCGLTQVSRFRKTSQVCDFFESARIKTFWSPEIAPVALFALSHAPMLHLNALLQVMGDEARKALAFAPVTPGALRKVPIDYCRVVLDSNRDRVSADMVEQVAMSLAYVPTRDDALVAV